MGEYFENLLDKAVCFGYNISCLRMNTRELTLKMRFLTFNNLKEVQS